MHLEVVLAAEAGALEQPVLDVGVAGRGQQRREPVQARYHFVGDFAGLDMARPSDHCRHAEGAFPVGVFLAAERRRRPHQAMTTGSVRCRWCRPRWCCWRCRDRRSASRSLPTSPSCSTMPSAYSLPGMPLWPCMDALNMGERAACGWCFIQVKNGLLAFICRCMKSIAAAVVSSSTVSSRFALCGPVSSILFLPPGRRTSARRVGRASP